MTDGMIGEIVQIISTVGFPIVAYILVYMDLRKKLETLTEAINRLNEKV